MAKLSMLYLETALKTAQALIEQELLKEQGQPLSVALPNNSNASSSNDPTSSNTADNSGPYDEDKTREGTNNLGQDKEADAKDTQADTSNHKAGAAKTFLGASAAKSTASTDVNAQFGAGAARGKSGAGTATNAQAGSDAGTYASTGAGAGGTTGAAAGTSTGAAGAAGSTGAAAGAAAADDVAAVEVPPEQYEEIINELSKLVKLGKVKNAKGKIIKSPNELTRQIKPGKLSYKQMNNIAKAGNLDSITFDVKNHAIGCTYSLGASLAISLALSIWQGQSIRQTLKTSLKSSLSSSVSSLAVSVGTSQALRTGAYHVGANLSTQMVSSVYQTQLGQKAINDLARFTTGSAAQGSQAVTQVANLVRSNIIASLVATTIVTAPDIYRAAFNKSMSWQQVAKNLTVNSFAIAGGSAGWIAGAAAGASLGSMVPLVGTTIGGVAGGMIGAFGGGTIAGKAAKTIADKIRPDDAKLMLDLCEQVGEQLCCDYLLSLTETQQLIKRMSTTITAKFLKQLYASGRTSAERLQWCYIHFEPQAELIVFARPRVTLPNEHQLTALLAQTLKENLSQEPSLSHK